MAANATELYIEMLDAVKREGYVRVASDPESPCTEETIEALPGRVFDLRFPHHNVVGCVEFDRRWAMANLLHFFAATEEAACLAQYNRHADRFLTRGQWIGAYGALAMPQVNACIERLKTHPNSRRCIISMGDVRTQDINRPACWSSIQFLLSRRGLDAIVYQRSLNLGRVMPLDCIVLTNILFHVAANTGLEVGALRWVVGSLHLKQPDIGRPLVSGQRNLGMILPRETANDPTACMIKLIQGEL